MKITVQTNQELKAITSNSFANPKFKFHTSDVKSINGIEIKTYLKVTNKYATHYVGGGSTEFFKAPFTVELKNQ